MRAFKILRWVIVTIFILLLLPPFYIVVMALFNGRTGIPGNVETSAMIANPPASLPAPLTLKVMTYNVHDLKWVSDFCPERMAEIARRVTELDPDIVGFQEAFIDADRKILLDGLAASRLQYFQYYPSGTVGSGLLIASAFPIRETWFHRFTASNPWYRLDEGDWWAGKGVALARIVLPDGGVIDFYNTHAQAGYGNPAYDLVRQDQMAELAAFINASRTRTGPAFLAGDMNCRVGDADYRIAEEGAGLVRLMTGDSRIDHVFGVRDGRYSFEVTETVKLDDEFPVGDVMSELSDHPGWMSTIRIVPTPHLSPRFHHAR